MLLSGGGHIFFTVPSLGAQHVAAGTMKVLAASSPTRVPEFPDVPTLKELGVDMEYSIWAGMFVPRGVPEDIKRTIGNVVAKSAADPEIKAAYAKSGINLAYQGAEEFQKWWDRDTERLAAIVNTIAKEQK